jgi:hypothetical protein
MLAVAHESASFLSTQVNNLSAMVANAISLRSIDYVPSVIEVVAGAPIGDLSLLVCPTA